MAEEGRVSEDAVRGLAWGCLFAKCPEETDEPNLTVFFFFFFLKSMTLFSLIDLVWAGWSEGKLWLCGPTDRSVQTVNNEEEIGRVVP